MNRKIIYVIFILLTNSKVFGQLKNISIGRQPEDEALADEYRNIKADTFIIINYGSSILKYEGYGIIMTKQSGQITINKFSLSRQNKIVKYKIENQKIFEHFKGFLGDSLLAKERNLLYRENIVVYDPDLIKVLYHSKEENWCIFFKQGFTGLTTETEKDNLVIWIRQLMQML